MEWIVWQYTMDYSGLISCIKICTTPRVLKSSKSDSIVFCLTRAISSPPSNQRLPPFSSVVLSRFLLLLLVAGIPQTRLVDVIVFRTPRFTTRGEVPCSKLLTSLGQLPFRASILAPTLHKHPNTQNDIQIYIYIKSY